MKTSCKAVEALLVRLIAGELGNEEHRSVKTHLQNCDACRCRFEQLLVAHRQQSIQTADAELAATMAAMESRFDVSEARRLREREMLSGDTSPMSADEAAEATLEESLRRGLRSNRTFTELVRGFFAPHPAWRWATVIGSTFVVGAVILVLLDRNPDLPNSAFNQNLDPEVGSASPRVPIPEKKALQRSKAAPNDTESLSIDLHDPIEEADHIASIPSETQLDEVITPDATSTEAAAITNLTTELDYLAVEPTAGAVAESPTVGITAETKRQQAIRREPSQRSASVAKDDDQAIQEMGDIINQLAPLTNEEENRTGEVQRKDLVRSLELAESELGGRKDYLADSEWYHREAEHLPSRGRSWGDVKSLTRSELTAGSDTVSPEDAEFWLTIGEGWYLLSKPDPQVPEKRYYLEGALAAYRQVEGLDPLTMAYVSRRIAYLELLVQ
jgi:Putative zinc-finger